MQKIRFTYTSSEIQPSVFLLLFFRMTGIYVYERFFDFDKSKKKSLLKPLMNNEDVKLIQEYAEFDLDLHYVVNATEYEMYKDYVRYSSCESDDRVLIIPEEMEEDISEEDRLISCCWKDDIQQLLTDIISLLAGKKLISQDTKNELNQCVIVYINNELWNVSLLGKYFYIAEEAEQYQEITGKYRNSIAEFFEILQQKECEWGDEKFLHLQYSALNLIYEGNLYCIRNNRTLIYNPNGLVQICKKMLNNGRGAIRLQESLNLLLAQVFDDILKDPNLAYEYYLPACQDYNAYAYYRKGIYWQDYAEDYENAIKYYTKSVYIYPEYYRAWYRMGRCYMLKNRCKEALDIFRNVGQILKPRLEADYVRPMEIEYLFKAQNQCGYICNKVLNNPEQSILENLEAVKAWEAIEKSKFFKLFGIEKENSIRKRVAKELNVHKIYMEICKLARRIGDISLEEKYFKLFNKTIKDSPLL